ncbi:hypothetical protein SAMN05428949_3886 [Chitinophaga sp. YR627]|uniref:hypothetical protein n=1 Tax=Chitinophaga sp. YR627 TaxID=1881041 RepID=UPI0008DFEBEF|nr:hypothetical protein [Chitinophaga sp. YR627]SFN92991.1 hypothetical protein SAMN05428949_3886 [Chitinophaga sp. YR627]
MNFRKILSVVWVSIKRSVRGKLWKWLLGGIGSLQTFLLFGKNFLGVEVPKSITLGIVGLSVIYLIRLGLIFLEEVGRYWHFVNRESIYGDAIITLTDVFAKVNELQRRTDFSDAEFMAVMIETCNGLKFVFDKKTKSKCSVSVKVPITGNVCENTIVLNLCRDSEHATIRDTLTYNEIKHTIIGNTPFQKILNGVITGNSKKFVYKNDNIRASEDYENTSRSAYPDEQLPYNSEIVYPLIPTISVNKSNYDMLGFLCIDCIDKEKFDDKYDVAIIKCASDRLYDLIVKRNYLKSVKPIQHEGTAA